MFDSHQENPASKRGRRQIEIVPIEHISRCFPYALTTHSPKQTIYTLEIAKIVCLWVPYKDVLGWLKFQRWEEVQETQEPELNSTLSVVWR